MDRPLGSISHRKGSGFAGGLRRSEVAGLDLGGKVDRRCARPLAIVDACARLGRYGLPDFSGCCDRLGANGRKGLRDSMVGAITRPLPG